VARQKLGGPPDAHAPVDQGTFVRRSECVPKNLAIIGAAIAEKAAADEGKCRGLGMRSGVGGVVCASAALNRDRRQYRANLIFGEFVVSFAVTHTGTL
jgi:hypothetical protein